MADQNDTPQIVENIDEAMQSTQENLPLAEGREIVQVNHSLAALRKTNVSEYHKLMRKLKSAERKIKQRDAEIQSMKYELVKSNTELAITKADLLGSLLNAERKIKELERECSDAKEYFIHHLLPVSESLNSVIRSRYGDASGMKTMPPPIVPASDDVNTLLPEKPNDLESTVLPAQSPEAEQNEQPPEGNESADDCVVVENDEMDTDDVATQYECGQCPKLFDSIALKFRHVRQAHKAASDANPEKTKSAKRVRQNVSAAKNRKKALWKSLARSHGQANVNKLAPVMEQLIRELRKQKYKAY